VKRCLAAALAALALPPWASGAAPSVDGTAYTVVNGATGEVLVAHDQRRRLPIASITKLMTVLVALEHAELDEVVVVRPSAVGVGGATIHLRMGERLTVSDLVHAVLVQSANDAAQALAEHVGRGSSARFVALMNARARALGLTDTHFVRPHGLDVPGHVSSARDVTLLARVAMQNPIVRRIVRKREAAIGGRRLHTWNDLLGRFRGLVGVKTGHTARAGWCEVAAVRRPGFTIYATLLGSSSREQRNTDLAELLRFGLSRYRVAPVVDAARVYTTLRVPYGGEPLALVAARSALRAVRLGRPLVERVVAPSVAPLPVRKGERLGEVRVYAGSRLVGSSALVASRSVSRAGVDDRLSWYAGRMLDNVRGWFS
jgi:serine-type D-Ala-D-Ala carboxypeptidase (penicillin-binding protein 5/6)